MATTLEDGQPVVPEERSNSPSMAPIEDIEKKQLSDTEDAAAASGQTFQRPIQGFKWFLVCFGLYLGAVLYGE